MVATEGITSEVEYSYIVMIMFIVDRSQILLHGDPQYYWSSGSQIQQYGYHLGYC